MGAVNRAQALRGMLCFIFFFQTINGNPHFAQRFSPNHYSSHDASSNTPTQDSPSIQRPQNAHKGSLSDKWSKGFKIGTEFSDWFSKGSNINVLGNTGKIISHLTTKIPSLEQQLQKLLHRKYSLQDQPPSSPVYVNPEKSKEKKPLNTSLVVKIRQIPILSTEMEKSKTGSTNISADGEQTTKKHIIKRHTLALPKPPNALLQRLIERATFVNSLRRFPQHTDHSFGYPVMSEMALARASSQNYNQQRLKDYMRRRELLMNIIRQTEKQKKIKTKNSIHDTILSDEQASVQNSKHQSNTTTHETNLNKEAIQNIQAKGSNVKNKMVERLSRILHKLIMKKVMEKNSSISSTPGTQISPFTKVSHTDYLESHGQHNASKTSNDSKDTISFHGGDLMPLAYEAIGLPSISDNLFDLNITSYLEDYMDKNNWNQLNPGLNGPGLNMHISNKSAFNQFGSPQVQTTDHQPVNVNSNPTIHPPVQIDAHNFEMQQMQFQQNHNNKSGFYTNTQFGPKDQTNSNIPITSWVNNEQKSNNWNTSTLGVNVGKEYNKIPATSMTTPDFQSLPWNDPHNFLETMQPSTLNKSPINTRSELLPSNAPLLAEFAQAMDAHHLQESSGTGVMSPSFSHQSNTNKEYINNHHDNSKTVTYQDTPTNSNANPYLELVQGSMNTENEHSGKQLPTINNFATPPSTETNRQQRGNIISLTLDNEPSIPFSSGSNIISLNYEPPKPSPSPTPVSIQPHQSFQNNKKNPYPVQALKTVSKIPMSTIHQVHGFDNDPSRYRKGQKEHINHIKNMASTLNSDTTSRWPGVKEEHHSIIHGREGNHHESANQQHAPGVARNQHSTGFHERPVNNHSHMLENTVAPQSHSQTSVTNQNLPLPNKNKDFYSSQSMNSQRGTNVAHLQRSFIAPYTSSTHENTDTHQYKPVVDRNHQISDVSVSQNNIMTPDTVDTRQQRYIPQVHRDNFNQEQNRNQPMSLGSPGISRGQVNIPNQDRKNVEPFQNEPYLKPNLNRNHFQPEHGEGNHNFNVNPNQASIQQKSSNFPNYEIHNHRPPDINAENNIPGVTSQHHVTDVHRGNTMSITSQNQNVPNRGIHYDQSVDNKGYPISKSKKFHHVPQDQHMAHQDMAYHETDPKRRHLDPYSQYDQQNQDNGRKHLNTDIYQNYHTSSPTHEHKDTRRHPKTNIHDKEHHHVQQVSRDHVFPNGNDGHHMGPSGSNQIPAAGNDHVIIVYNDHHGTNTRVNQHMTASRQNHHASSKIEGNHELNLNRISKTGQNNQLSSSNRGPFDFDAKPNQHATRVGQKNNVHTTHERHHVTNSHMQNHASSAGPIEHMPKATRDHSMPNANIGHQIPNTRVNYNANNEVQNHDMRDARRNNPQNSDRTRYQNTHQHVSAVAKNQGHDANHITNDFYQRKNTKDQILSIHKKGPDTHRNHNAPYVSANNIHKVETFDSKDFKNHGLLEEAVLENRFDKQPSKDSTNSRPDWIRNRLQKPEQEQPIIDSTYDVHTEHNDIIAGPLSQLSISPAVPVQKAPKENFSPVTNEKQMPTDPQVMSSSQLRQEQTNSMNNVGSLNDYFPELQEGGIPPTPHQMGQAVGNHYSPIPSPMPAPPLHVERAEFNEVDFGTEYKSFPGTTDTGTHSMTSTSYVSKNHNPLHEDHSRRPNLEFQSRYQNSATHVQPTNGYVQPKLPITNPDNIVKHDPTDFQRRRPPSQNEWKVKSPTGAVTWATSIQRTSLPWQHNNPSQSERHHPWSSPNNLAQAGPAQNMAHDPRPLHQRPQWIQQRLVNGQPAYNTPATHGAQPGYHDRTHAVQGPGHSPMAGPSGSSQTWSNVAETTNNMVHVEGRLGEPGGHQIDRTLPE